jgi:plasmid stability protein
MSDYTKVNIRKDIWELVKVRAAADNRSATNYIETLLLADLEVDERAIAQHEAAQDLDADTSVSDLQPSDPEAKNG